MKKLIAITTLLACAAWVNAQSVSSVNAAGFVKKSIDGGQFILVHNPFETFDGTTNTVEDVFDALPVGTTCFVWNSGSQTFSTVQKLADAFWFPQNVALPRGTGVFIQTPPASPTADIFLFGEVPGATSHASTAFNLLQGFNAIGNPYPTDITIEASGLEDATQPGDQVAIWDAGTQSYTFVQKLAPAFWFPQNTVIPAGTAFFLQISNAGGATYTEDVPYTWPNN